MHKTLDSYMLTGRGVKTLFVFRSLCLGSESRHSKASFFSVMHNDVILLHRWDNIITYSFPGVV